MQHPAMCVSRPLCGSERTEPTPARRSNPCGVVAGWGTSSQCYGGHGERETPGLIPNPEAKPFSADGTARGTGWESRTPPDITSRNGVTATAGPPFLHTRTPVPFREKVPGDGKKYRGTALCGGRVSAATVGGSGRGAHVVREPLVQAGAGGPGIATLFQRGAFVQPAGRLPVLARVQRLVAQQLQPRVVGRVAARRP